MTTQEQEADARQKRILSNRESARRSRMRKQQYIGQLEQRVISLEAQVMALTDKLRSKETIIQIIKEVTGISIDTNYGYGNYNYNLRNQFLNDVCEIAKGIADIPESLIAQIMNEVTQV
ncbi:bZIP transcription factor 53-like [Spinacia oleracea]|uniref:BZIP transcription factor 53-like n=1 Tax=Spinacia oleracea TaxID=3562 RepID=A0A9R0IUP6_SPIOL|nr:bZIP transcription factor 53-like [Spinacia oleracea]